jgi:hypothetical protein
MLKTKEIRTAAAVFACALGIGFVMQNSEAAGTLYSKTAKPVAPQGAVLDVEEIILMSAEFDQAIQLPTPDPQLTKVSTPQALTAPQVPEPAIATSCDITATARPIAAAMVNLTMDAPCMKKERLSVHHNGMIFSATTDDMGRVDLDVPALARQAVFILAFTNGDGAVAQTVVEELSDYDRVVLQWKGETGFQIHAREFGAEYGSEGHVWAGAPRDMVTAVTGEGGFLTVLGAEEVSDGLMAEVYTFPRAAPRNGSIYLSVEAEVDRQNCGLEIEAQSLEVSAGGPIKSQDLSLAVPECDAVGSFLVLNNLLQDLKVAQN